MAGANKVENDQALQKRIIELLMAGNTAHAVAKKIGAYHSTVDIWKQKFEKDGYKFPVPKNAKVLETRTCKCGRKFAVSISSNKKECNLCIGGVKRYADYLAIAREKAPAHAKSTYTTKNHHYHETEVL